MREVRLLLLDDEDRVPARVSGHRWLAESKERAQRADVVISRINGETKVLKNRSGQTGRVVCPHLFEFLNGSAARAD